MRRGCGCPRGDHEQPGDAGTDASPEGHWISLLCGKTPMSRYLESLTFLRQRSQPQRVALSLCVPGLLRVCPFGKESSPPNGLSGATRGCPGHLLVPVRLSTDSAVSHFWFATRQKARIFPRDVINVTYTATPLIIIHGLAKAPV